MERKIARLISAVEMAQELRLYQAEAGNIIFVEMNEMNNPSLASQPFSFLPQEA